MCCVKTLSRFSTKTNLFTFLHNSTKSQYYVRQQNNCILLILLVVHL